MNADDELRRIAAGDAQAFGRWMARAERPVRGSLTSFAAAVDTEAVVQEAFLRVWQVADRVRPDGRPEPLLRFALRVARNLALTQLRGRHGSVSSAPDELEGAAAAFAAQLEPSSLPDPFLRAAIAACREALPRQPRRALEGRLGGGGGVPDATIAEELGMRLNTFLQNFTRARRMLARCLRSRGVELDGEGA